ncbi:MAG: hypothetical protein ACOH2H_15170 [Cypionkella sp.]
MSSFCMWGQLLATYRTAYMARATMRNQATTQDVRDAAVIDYGRACDRLMDQLETMADRQLLTQIGSLLTVRGR